MTSQSTIDVGIYFKPGVWDLARSAYLADFDADPDSPGSFVGWLGRALEDHALRSPMQRAELVATVERHPAVASAVRKSFNRTLRLLVSTTEKVDDAIVIDRVQLGRALGRSAFTEEAVLIAAAEARRRLGRDLPPPPQKLSNRMPRSRPAT